GQRLYSQTFRGDNRDYYCRNGQGHGKFTCPGVRMKEELVDQAVVNQIARLAQEPQMQAILIAEAEQAAEGRDAALRAEAAQLLERLTVDRHDRYVTVRVKIRLLPEREITIDLGKRYRPKKRHQTGVLSLTRRELAVLHWLDEGKSPRDAAVLMGVSYNTVR